MLACPRGGDGGLQVGPAGRADGDDVDRRVGQQIIEFVIGPQTVVFGQLVGRRLGPVETGHQLGPGTLAIAFA